MLKVSLVDGEGGPAQMDYALSDPASLFYCNPRFMRLVAGHLGASPGWLVAERGGEPAGMLPFLAKQGPLGPAYNSLAYYGSNGGIIQPVADPEAKAALVDAFYGMAAEEKACSATLITNPLTGDAAFYEERTGYTFRDERIGQVTHFPQGGPDALMGQFEDPRPRNIRRALKEGVTVEKRRDREAVDFLHATHVANILAVNGLPKSRSFFDSVLRELPPEDWAVFTATLGGRPIAALLVFYFNKTVEYFTPAIVEEHRSTQALALCIYEAMRDAMGLGYANWNWGGTWLSQGGVYDFKKRWGTSEYRYYYHTRMYDAALASATPAFLLQHYPGFFLIPFKNLIREREETHA